jgi:hypothetical protein
VNALADPRVAKHLNDNFVCTYLKVGAFQIIQGQKVGGNVASYFCLPNTSVIHAIAGQVNANQLLKEARWANDIRKSAQAVGTQLDTGKTDMKRYANQIGRAHMERYHDENRTVMADRHSIPVQMPRLATAQTQTHWLLARNPTARLDAIYPIVWQQILNEKLSALPVAQR